MRHPRIYYCFEYAVGELKRAHSCIFAELSTFI